MQHIQTQAKPLLRVLRAFRVFLVLAVMLLTGVYSYTRGSGDTHVSAATSSNLNFQARLLNSAGNTVPDGYYNISFNLYNVSSGGSSLWSESYYDANGVTAGNDNRVRVVNGYLSVNLASQTAFPAINWDQDMWLTMNIGGAAQTATPTYDGEMNPRIKLTAVPYAFQAKQSEKLNLLQGANTGTLNFTTLTGNRDILLPDASGTVCLQSATTCGFAASSGSVNYIQNTGGSSTPQASSNFNIQATSSTTNGTIGGIIRGAAGGQTVDLLQLQASDGTNLIRFHNTGMIQISQPSNSHALQTLVTGDVQPRLIVRSQGLIEFGAGGSVVVDTNLYRSAADTLKTDDSFSVGAGLSVAGASTLSDNLTVNGSNMRLLENGTTPGFYGTFDVDDLAANQTYTFNQGGLVCTDSGNCNGAGASLQTSYNNSTGGTMPEIRLDSTRNALDIQDANTTLGATTNLLAVRGSNAEGLGSLLFGVQASGDTLIAGNTTIQGSNGLDIGVASTTGGKLNFYNSSNNNVVTLQAGTTGGTGLTLTLPTADGANTDCLKTNGAGQLMFGNCLNGGGTGGGVTFLNSFSGAVSVAGTANQITVSDASNTITLSLPQNINTISTPTFGGMTLNGDLLMGAADKVDFANEVGDKVHYYTNTYGRGIEGGTLTDWTAGTYRLRVGGTSVSTGTQVLAINSTGIKYGAGTATQALDITGNGLFSGTVTGTTLNGTTGINTGAGSGTQRLDSTGALSNITGYSQTSGNFLQTGSGTFGTGTGVVSLNGATSVTGANTFTVGTGLASFGGNIVVEGSASLASIKQRTTAYNGTDIVANAGAETVYFEIPGVGNPVRYHKIATVKIAGNYQAAHLSGYLSTGYHVGSERRTEFDFTAYAGLTPGTPAVTYTKRGLTTERILVTVRPDAGGVGTAYYDIYMHTGHVASNYGQLDIKTEGGAAITVWQAGSDTGTTAPTDTLVNPNGDYNFDTSGIIDIAGSLRVGTSDAFQVSSAGAVTAIGVNSGTGLLQGTGGLTVTGAALLNFTGTAATTIGNTTGALTLTGSNASTLVLAGVTLTATELNRLDGKDAALLDVNDAVATVITGTGALAAGSIASGFGTIATANTIQGTQLISTVANGTAPLTVTSTTKVTNLNVDLLDGLDSTDFAPASGSGSYIQNQNAGPQANSNFNISGNGTLGGNLAVTGTSTLTGNVGIGTAAPTQKLQVYNGNAQIDYGHLRFTNLAVPAALTAAVNPVAGNLTGNYLYRVTFVTAQGETSVGTPSAVVAPAAQQVNLTNIPIGTSDVVTQRKVYRTLAGGTAYYFLATIANNTATTYTDNIADTSLTVAANSQNTTGGRTYLNGALISMVDTGGQNTSLGYTALDSVTTGNYNTAQGWAALSGNTTGFYNTAVGGLSMATNTTGYYNTAVGMQTLYGNTTGIGNLAQGMQSLYANTTGNYNTGLGYQTLRYNTTGSNNVAQGYQAGFGVTGGSDITGNVLSGYRAGYGLLTGGNYNTLLGYAAGDNITTGARNITIGYNTNAVSATANDQLNIGNAIYGNLATGNIGIGDTTPAALLTVGDGDLFQVNASGEIAAVAGYTQSSGNFSQTGTGTFGTGTGAVSLNGATSVTGSNTLTVGTGATSLGGTLAVTGNTTMTGTLSVAGRTVQLSNFNPEYRWKFGGTADLNWKKIADITLGTSTYSGASFQVDIIDAKSNLGHTSDAVPLRYYVSAVRSVGALNSHDNGTVAGPISDYVRLVKTATGTYELQVRQVGNYRYTEVIAHEISSNDALAITYADTPVDGSTTGDIYMPSVTGYTQNFANINVAGYLQTGGTTRLDNVGNLSNIGTIAASGAVTAGTYNGQDIDATANFTGTVAVASTIQGSQLISTVADGTAPLQVTSTTMVANLNVEKLGGFTESQIGSSLRSGYMASGGGNVGYNSPGTGASWSTRFIVISNSKGTDFATSGYFDITQPVDGTVITGANTANVTVASGAIPIPSWGALYYILPTGSAATSLPGNFRIVSYAGTAFSIPSNWLLIASHNSDNGTMRFVNGLVLRSGQSGTAGSVNNVAFNTSVTTPLIQNAGTLNISATGANQINFNTNGVLEWSVLSTGELQGNGTSTVRSSTGNLTLASNGGNGNIILTPNGTGGISLNGNTTVSGTQFTNNGSTLNTAQVLGNFITGGAIGTAAATVDVDTSFTINQTTAGQTLSLPSPTTTTAGRIVYVANIGSTPFTMHGVSVVNGNAQTFIWNGTAWTATNIDGAGNGVTSVGTLDALAKSANGAGVSGNQVFLQTADATNPGLVSAGAQIFGGAKTFSGQIIASGGINLGTQTLQGTTAVIDFTNFDVSSAGAVTAVGVNSGSGLLQGTGGLTLTGATLLNSTGTAATSIGNTTGTLTLTGSNASTVVLDGVTLSTAELNRLDGKDVALVDTNDAVATAITGTGALNAGTITSGFGTIDNADTITGTTLNGTTGINTGAGAGTLRLNSAGALSSITGYSQASGTFAFSGAGNFSVDSAAFDVTTAGVVSGITTLNASGLITSLGLTAGAGLIQGTGGLTLTGATTINSTGANTTSIGAGTSTGANTIGNATGTLTLTGSNASTLVLAGVILTATELNRLDGKDAALLDVNDAVATAITGTGVLTVGSIASGFGSISTASAITTSSNISTTGSGTITAAGLLTANAGLTTTGVLVQQTGIGAAVILDRTDGVIASLKSGLAKSAFFFDSSGFFSIATDTRANIAAGTGAGTDILNILPGGNVGIGDTLPSTRLAIGGIGIANGLTLGDDAAGSVNLYQSTADVLSTDDSFTSNGYLVAFNSAATKVTIGDVGTGAAGLLFGSSNDTNLYRGAADTLRTDDAFSIQRTAATAFQVQSAAAADTMFTIDTSGNTIKVGNSSGTATATTQFVLDTATTAPSADGSGVNGAMYYDSTLGRVQCYESGSWGSCSTLDQTVTLTPEYAGAVLTGDGTNNTGTMTSDFCSGSSLLNIPSANNPCGASEQRNYYSWTAQATNDYDIWVRYQLPSDFAGFAASNPVQFSGWRSSSSAGTSVTMTIYNAAGTVCGTATSISNTTTWTQTNYTSAGCTPSANQVLTIRITLSAGVNNEIARAGDITISYKSK